MHKAYRATLIGYYKRNGGHFFDDKMMDQFNSVVDPTVWQIGTEGKDSVVHYVFVTGERFADTGPRRWTVRSWRTDRREVDDVSSYLEYVDRLDAMSAAREHAERLEAEIAIAIAEADVRSDELLRVTETLLSEEVISTIHSQLLYFGTTEDGVKKAIMYALKMAEEKGAEVEQA